MDVYEVSALAALMFLSTGKLRGIIYLYFKGLGKGVYIGIEANSILRGKFLVSNFDKTNNYNVQPLVLDVPFH